eukprot:TRINITY_DN9401_c0_g1_i7.p1 TRINITY_DN9401_c0_g1~~TRINITY_DN9401_c0_g1_i7.p1  ORF type:complete len:592 (+),score=140.02 TRINITY_DN9401_c0_g1_i7:92-1867(+)
MEYADGGNLEDRIELYKKKDEKLSLDTILNWTAQITLGLMLIHINRIIHRDIKSQNIFLVKTGDEEVIKIGDFGISKKLGTIESLVHTYCGTPYFMSPEQVRGEAYNEKSDMWSLGCVIYELTAFYKPFNSDSIPKLGDDIMNKEFRTLPSGTDPLLIMLISSLLVKDQRKRPSVWEFAEQPEIRRRIDSFVARHKCMDTVARVLEASVNDLCLPKPRLSSEGRLVSVQTEDEQLEAMVNLLRRSVKPKSVKIGWFKSSDNCVSGSELVEGALKFLGESKNVVEMLENFFDKGVLYSVNGETNFINSDTVLYKFQMDRENIAANMAWPWVKQHSKPLIVSARLLIRILNIYKKLLKESKQGTLYIESGNLAESNEYIEYVAASAELQGVNLLSLDRKQKFIFFLNVYQCMCIHYLLEYPPQQTSAGILARLWNSVKPESFYYNIAGMEFTLGQVKHGVLRANRKSPDAYFRELSTGDKRNVLNGYNDPRALFLFTDYPGLPTQVEVIPNKEKLDETLERVVKEFIAGKTCFDDYNGELVLPMVFKRYAGDFEASEEDRVRWAWKYFAHISKFNVDDVVAGIAKKSIIVRYV